jgi:ABC-type transport system involved in multi-copper enzyme maturation permease subunit
VTIHLIKYVLLAAIRDRMLWGVVAVSLLGVCLSIFSGSASIIEQDQFVVTYIAGGVRLLSLIGLVLFVVFYTRKSFDAREVEFLLTRPISRLSFVLSHMTAFTLLSLFAAVFVAILVLIFSRSGAGPDGILLWSAGIFLEFVIVSNTAFFFSMVLSSPVSAGLSTLGFYVLARMMGGLLIIADSNDLSGTFDVHKGLSYVMQLVAVFVPRLDLLVQTNWLMYGGVGLSDWLMVILQGGVFLALIATATIIDLKRRQF